MALWKLGNERPDGDLGICETVRCVDTLMK